MRTAATRPYRIFISHSSKDDQFGLQLAEDLRHILVAAFCYLSGTGYRTDCFCNCCACFVHATWHV